MSFTSVVWKRSPVSLLVIYTFDLCVCAKEHCRNYCLTIGERMRYNWDRTQAPLYLTNKTYHSKWWQFHGPYTNELKTMERKKTVFSLRHCFHSISRSNGKRLGKAPNAHSIPRQIAFNRFGLLTFSDKTTIEWTRTECADIWNICVR